MTEDNKDKPMESSEYWAKIMSGTLGQDQYRDAAWTMFMRVCVPLTMRLLIHLACRNDSDPKESREKLTNTMMEAYHNCYMKSVNDMLGTHTDMLEKDVVGKIFGSMIPDSEEVRIKAVSALKELESSIRDVLLVEDLE